MYKHVEESRLTFNLPDDLVSGLAEIAMVDGAFPDPTVNPDRYDRTDVAQFVADEYTSPAVSAYIQMRKAAPGFPAQLAETRARLNRQMDEEIFGGNPNLN